jgi:CRISPR-associated protein Cmr2
MDEVHLVVFHVGPVQEFISSARRSRDLWFGSWLLSELSKAAAEEIVDQNGGDAEWSLIFPAPQSLVELRCEEFNAANRIVARTRKDPAELGEAARTQVQARLRQISDETFSRVEKVAEFDRSAAELQVDDLLEFFWASCPLRDDYVMARLEAEALMAARKVTRDFAPSKWGGPEDKSSLDGLRESVIPWTVYQTMSQDELRWKYGVRRGERLCGVGLLKRHGRRGRGDRFFSTSHVAAMPLLEQLNESHREAVDEYVGSLRELGIGPDALDTVPLAHPVFGYNDGHLLFPERLAEFFDGDKLEQAQEALNRFLGRAFAGERPGPYYALLHADGDHMGKVITHQQSIEQHRALSRSASLFAQKVGPIVDRFKGSLIYAGGDDVLALLPLHTALECSRALADAFREQMSSFAVLDSEGEIGLQPTLSVGLAIVHHLEPLSEALELVREAEAYAKSVDGKNALAITLSKRGGSERTAGGTWGVFDQRLDWFMELHRKEEIPADLAYELRSLALALESPEDTPDDLLNDVLSAEVKRILGRKKAERGLRPVSQDVIAKMVDITIRHGLPVMQLADELIIAREFASASKLVTASLPDAPSGEGEKE